MNNLTEAVAAAAASLGTAHLRALADAYRPMGTWSAAHTAAARQSIPAVHHHVADRLNTAWAAEPTLPGTSIARALEAVRVASASADAPTVEVVVTWPASPAASVRLTSEVVCQLINRAQRRVTLVSYAAYHVAPVVHALDAAVARGVDVALVLESADHLDGGGDAALRHRYRAYHWPSDRRVPPQAKLHAKAVIVDDRDVLLTSANLTNAAYDKNIELGVLCRGGDVARQVQRHFDTLLSAGVLAPVFGP